MRQTKGLGWSRFARLYGFGLCQTGSRGLGLCQTGSGGLGLCQTGSGGLGLCQMGSRGLGLCQTGSRGLGLCHTEEVYGSDREWGSRFVSDTETEWGS